MNAPMNQSSRVSIARLLSLAIPIFIATSMVRGAEPDSVQTLKLSVVEGNWKAIAENTATDSTTHFAKAVANGVLGNYRIMYEEFKQSKGGEAEIDTFCADLVKSEPRSASAHFVAAARLYDKGDTDGALSGYKKAIELNPNFAPPYVQLGLHYGQKMHDSRLQLEWTDKAIKADSTYAPAYVAKGLALFETGQRDGAVAQFETALQLLTDQKVTSGQAYAQACYNLGWMHLNRSSPDNDKGIDLMQKAIAADPFTLEAYTELGIAYKRKNRYADAIKTYKDGIGKGAGGAKIYFNLGVSEARSGNTSAARVALEKAASLDPNGQVGSLARQWLGQLR